MEDITHNSCAGYGNYKSVYDKVDRIIAIGDIHGDIKYLQHLLKFSRVIDDDNNWIGGNTYVVQLGDQIDSCRPINSVCTNPEATKNDNANDIKIINFLDNLNIQAKKFNGAVISLLGNHEIMNMSGIITNVSYKNLEDVGGIDGRINEFSKNGKTGRTLICTHPSCIIIGSNIFVHAGILPNIMELIPKLKEMLKFSVVENMKNMPKDVLVDTIFDKVLRGKISSDIFDVIGKEYSMIIKNTIMEEQIPKKIIHKLSKNKELLHILYKKSEKLRDEIIKRTDIYGIDNMHPFEAINTAMRMWLLNKIDNKYDSLRDAVDSIFWNRLLGSIPTGNTKYDDVDMCDNYLAPVLKFLNVNNMIVGHTPQFSVTMSGLNGTCDKKLYRIDIGGSDTFNLFDSKFVSTGNRSSTRMPQILEIIDDIHMRVIRDDSYNTMKGGKPRNIFKKYYMTN